jgi:D-glycero-D-manno-heptose 1,7-bisphosphate phosphatase
VSEEPRRAVFLDRDGTLIEDVDYLTRLEQLRVLPAVPQALARLCGAGLRLVVVTNQSAVARGWLTEQQLRRIHAELGRRLAARGAPIEAFYYCPHLPGAPVERYAVACPCRKPEPGLILRAARELGLDLGRSYAVGDSERDVEAGRRAGCRTVRIGAEQGTADAAAPDLPAAADIIVEWERERK